MFNEKYSNLLTIILTVTIISIIGIAGVIIIKKYHSYDNLADASDAVSNFENKVISNNNTISNVIEDKSSLTGINEIITSDTTGTTSDTKYKGFNVVATIQIPSIDLKYPVLEKVNKTSLETSVALLYTSQGINEPGNTVIIGHNYKNGTMFSNVKNLKNGDAIYITDLQGRKVKYIVYDMYRASGSDGDYISRNTNGKREISLSTCTDDSKARTIVLAKEE